VGFIVGIEGDGETRFELRPNRSLSNTETLAFFALTCAVSFSIAIGFLLMGAWIVLPFAGLEMGLLGLVLYLVSVRSGEREEVVVSRDTLRVARFGSRTARSWSFQRHWVRVRLEPSFYRWYAKRLKIVSHGRALEIGRMLAEEERMKLAEALEALVGEHADRPRAAGAGPGQ
jgi:uncharacterized membrane protein